MPLDTSNPDVAYVWTVIILLAILTFLIRFSFIGFWSHRKPGALSMRLLKFVPVSILPALIAPALLWPSATGGQFDLGRFAAVLGACAVAWIKRSAMLGFVLGLILLVVFTNTDRLLALIS